MSCVRKISSRATFWNRRVFPVLWFGFLALWSCAAGYGVFHKGVPIFVLLVPAVMAVFGFLMMRWLVFPLADEVFLDGDEVIVRKGGREIRFPVRQIINVDSSVMTRPERITLLLREPCEWGREIVFTPTFHFRWFTRHPIAGELIARANGLPVPGADKME